MAVRGTRRDARERSSTTPVLSGAGRGRRIRRPEESGGRKRPNQAYQMGTRPGCRPGPWPKPDQTRRDSTTVFSVMGSERSPAFLPILLLLSGDIETNPGPWPCPTCQRPYTRRLGSILCRTCGDWTHRTQRCAGLRQGQEVPPWWVCSSCHPNHGQAAQPPPNSPPPRHGAAPAANAPLNHHQTGHRHNTAGQTIKLI